MSSDGAMAAAPRRREFGLFLLMGIVLVVSRILASRLLLVYDDAFITFTYSRNLAMGHGLVYFPGDTILGTTAPMFAIVCSAFYALHLPMPATAVAFNILLDCAIFYLTVSSIRRGQRLLAGLVFMVIFAVSPMIARVTVGAMETSLYLACALWAITLFLKGRGRPAFVVAALCYFLRPEALLLLVLLGIMQIGRSRGRDTVALALLSVVCLAVPLGAIYLNHGQILPQSVVAKSDGGMTLMGVFKQLLAPDPLLAALLVPAVWGGVMLFRGRRSGGRATHAGIVMAWCGMYLCAYGVARPHVWSWYGVPVYYGVAVMATHGVVDLVRRVRLDDVLMRMAAALALVPLVVWGVVLFVKGPTPAEKDVRDRIAAWCEANVVDTQATIAASDIGVIGYYSRARIYDLVGLVWPAATDYDSWADATKDVRPDYLFLNVAGYTVDMMRDPDLAAMYAPLVRFSPNEDMPLDLGTTPIPQGWRPEYIVYRRTP